jgi:hypothetical protein
VAIELLFQRQIPPEFVTVLVRLDPLILEFGFQDRFDVTEGPFDVCLRGSHWNTTSRLTGFVKCSLIVAADFCRGSREFVVGLQGSHQGMNSHQAQKLCSLGVVLWRALVEGPIKLLFSGSAVQYPASATDVWSNFSVIRTIRDPNCHVIDYGVDRPLHIVAFIGDITPHPLPAPGTEKISETLRLSGIVN